MEVQTQTGRSGNRNRRLAFVALAGGISLFLHLAGPGIPLGWVGKVGFADVPALIAAALTGPLGGLIVGAVFAIGSPSLLALLPTSLISFTVLGYLAKNRGWGWVAIPVAHVGIAVPLGSAFYTLIYGFPYVTAFALGLGFQIPGTVVATILCISLKRVPWLKNL